MTRFNPVLARAALAAAGYNPSKIVQFTGPLRGGPKDIRDAELAIDDHGYVIKDRLGHCMRPATDVELAAARPVAS